MSEDIYNPLWKYRDEYREKFAQLTAEAFAHLTDVSGVDAADNAALLNEISRLERRIEDERRIRAWKGFVVGVVLPWIISLGFRLWQCVNPSFAERGMAASEDEIVGLIVLLVVSLALEFAVLIPWYNASTALLVSLKERRDAAEAEAWRQMEPLNRLYDWDMTTALIQKTVPQLKFDKYFTERRLRDLRMRFGWQDDFNGDRSVLFAQTGQINGNPFVIGECLRREWGVKAYTGSLDIAWTERENDWDGKTRMVRRTQTLRATVSKPCPYFHTEKFVLYGNEAAPRLVFSRGASDLSREEGDGHGNSQTQREIDRLESMSRNREGGRGYTIMSNKEFEALFHATNRNDEIEFRLLFTSLAQKQMLDLLKDRTVGFGDDFAMCKESCITMVWPGHLQEHVIDTDPVRFKDFNLRRAEKRFRQFNEDYFRNIYFALAPLLAIPMYQQPPTYRVSYESALDNSACFWEHESIANYLGEDAFRPSGCTTRCLLKTMVESRSNGSSRIRVTANGYRGIDHIDLVRVHGGDGKDHDVPVHWTEYLPVEATRIVSVAEQATVESQPLHPGEHRRRSLDIRFPVG